jgi:uncharacterized lipoprotein YddW (UPF0748 family)
VVPLPVGPYATQLPSGELTLAEIVIEAKPVPEFRGFWADAFSAGFKSTAQIDAMVSAALTGNHNAIIVEVLAYHDNASAGHGAYWNSTIVPRAPDIVGGIDPLARVVQQAHANGIEVHAWLVPYRAAWLWPPGGNAVLAEHPQWLMTTLDNMGGAPSPIGLDFMLDPGSPDVQEYLVAIVRELLANYEIDGIHWDRMQYPESDAGYPADATCTSSGLARFREISGFVGTPSPTYEPWSDFRRRAINELVRRSRAEIAIAAASPARPPRLSAALLAAGDSPGDFRSSQAFQRFQDWDLWLRQGWLDAGGPTLFFSEQDVVQAQRYRAWVDWLMAQNYPRHLFIGLSDQLNDSWQLCTQIEYLTLAGADGWAIAFYSQLPSLPCLATPAAPPVMPWRDRATAVEGTLYGRVVSRLTERPVYDATVYVNGGAPVQTDGNGYYTITMIPAAAQGTAYDIIACKAGYPSVTHADVRIVAGEVRYEEILLTVASDFDEDGDVDGDDYGSFETCASGPGIPLASGCEGKDFDGDQDVDHSDFGIFQRCYSGGGIAADPNCDD